MALHPNDAWSTVSVTEFRSAPNGFSSFRLRISLPNLQISLDRLPTICYTESMTKMGRPKKAAKERSSHLVALRLTPAEHKLLEQAAEKARLSVSDYIRLKVGLRGEQ